MLYDPNETPEDNQPEQPHEGRDNLPFGDKRDPNWIPSKEDVLAALDDIALTSGLDAFQQHKDGNDAAINNWVDAMMRRTHK